jgi:hypothetical protein
MNFKRLSFSIVLYGFLMLFTHALVAQAKMETLDIKRVWDKAPHNAFTDLGVFKGKLFIVFREGDGHIPNADNTGNGKIRIISSTDGDFWESAGLIELNGVDLRDPKISITPKNRILIVMGGSVYDKGELKSISTYYSLADPDGKKFSTPEPVVLDPQIGADFNWLWRVTWYDKTGYGVVYQSHVDGDPGKTKAFLMKTDKGNEFELITELKIDGNPNEATVRFLSGAEMMIIARRGSDDKLGMIGTSKAPYTDWTWNKLDIELGGPNFDLIPINKVILGTRVTGPDGPYTALLMGKKNEPFVEVMKMASGGDTGYPGIYSIAGFVWMSYYSSHEGKSSIYYARIPYSFLEKQ